MKQFQIAFIVVILVVGIGGAGVGAVRVRNQGARLIELRQAAERAEAAGKSTRRERDALRQSQSEPAHLADEAIAPGAEENDADPLGPHSALASRWLEKGRALRDGIARYPEKRIPELALLTDEELLLAAQTLAFETDDLARKALNSLRTSAKAKIPDLLQAALRDFAAANEDNLPANIARLTPYLKPPLTAEMLDRYEIVRTGLLSQAGDGWIAAEKYPVDDLYDTRYVVAANGWGRATVTKPVYLASKAIEAFKAANANREPISAPQLIPYLEAPLDSSDLQARFSAWQSNRDTIGLQMSASMRKAPPVPLP